MIDQLFIFKISANSTVFAEPPASPLSPAELSAGVLRAIDPRKLLSEERASFAVGSHEIHAQRFDDLLLAAATSNASKKKRFVFRDLERVNARIRESGQGILPSSAFASFVREIIAAFNAQSVDGRTQSVMSKDSFTPVSLDVAPTHREESKSINPFLASDDEDGGVRQSSPSPSPDAGRRSTTPVIKEVKLQNRVSKAGSNPAEPPRKSLVTMTEEVVPGPDEAPDRKSIKRMYVMEFEEQGESGADPKNLRQELISDNTSDDASATQSRPNKSKVSPYQNAPAKKTVDPIRLEISAEKKRIREEYLLQQAEAARHKPRNKFHMCLLGAALLVLGAVIILWLPTRAKTL